MEGAKISFTYLNKLINIEISKLRLLSHYTLYILRNFSVNIPFLIVFFSYYFFHFTFLLKVISYWQHNLTFIEKQGYVYLIK